MTTNIYHNHKFSSPPTHRQKKESRIELMLGKKSKRFIKYSPAVIHHHPAPTFPKIMIPPRS